MMASPWDVFDTLRPPTPPPPERPPVMFSAVGADSAYAAAALEREAGDVASAQQGSRDHTLTRASFNLGQLVAGGALNADDVIHALSLAAGQCGLTAEHGQKWVEDKVRRCMAKGGEKGARGVPERPDVEGYVRSLPTTGAVEYRVDAATGEVVSSYAPRPLERLDLGLLAEPCPEPEWLIEGRMTRASLTILGAKPGIGKSWTALDLALALTTGRDWLGHTVPGKFRVLYIDVENGEVLARRRLQQLGADVGAIGDRLYYVTQSVIFPGGEDSRRYRDTIADFQPDLVIIDTLASSAPSAEKDTEAMSLFLSDIWHTAREAGAACMVLAHLRKSQQGAGKDDPLDSFRGAGHLAGAASRAWLLDPRGPEKFILRDVKTREFTANRPVVIELVDEDMPAGSLVPKKTVLTVDGYEDDDVSPEAQFQTAILEHLDSSPLGQASAATLIHIADALGITEGSARNKLTSLVREGILHRPKTGIYARPAGPALHHALEAS